MIKWFNQFKLLLIFFLFFTHSYSQTINDYRSIASGNWTSIAIWEIYNGTTWAAAITYPGQTAGTNDVTISNGTTITLNSNITNSINSVTIGDEIGGIETLSITGTSSINTLEFNIAYDGLLRWDANVTFSLPTNASFYIESPNPNGLVLGTDHGVYINPTGCNVNKKLVIGTTIYTNCNGGGPNPKPLTFEEANNNGGNLGVSPSSNTPVCLGNIVNLSANPNGEDYNANPTSATYLWSIISPTGNSFTSTLENPTDTPTTIDTYIYEVTISLGGKSNTNTVSVTINNCNRKVITNRRVTYRVNK